MTTRVQTTRSSIAGNRPAAGTRPPGELFVNFADLQLGVINASQAPVDLVAVRFFNIGANYAIGDFAIYNGQLYRSTAAQTPTAWVASNWDLVQKASDITGYLPLTGGTMTGKLILNADPVNPLDAATKHYVDSKPAGIADAGDSQNYVRQAGAWITQQSTLPGGGLNKFRNGAMNVWQRGNGPIAPARRSICLEWAPTW